MRFADSQWLWAAALIPFLAWFLLWVGRRRRLVAARFADPASWQLLTGGSAPARFWKGVLMLAALAFLILGVAGPQWGARAVMLKRRGLDIVVALDVSRSMLATDLKPNRLERAKREIASILDRLSGDRVGLVVFAGDAFVQCPLTLDAAAARLLLDAADVGSGGRPGTNLEAPIRTAVGMFEKTERQFKTVILISDGEGHEGDPLAAAQDAAKEGVRIYTVGIGTPAGDPIPEENPAGQQVGFKKDESGQVVLSKLDEVTMQKIALATDGRYFRAGPDQMELDALFKELSTLEKKEMEGRLFTEFEERFQYFLLPAFLLLALELAILETPRQRLRSRGLGDPTRRSSAAVAAVIAAVLWLLTGGITTRADQFAKHNNAGNRLAAKDRYDEALREYQSARVERPDMPAVDYNVGNAYYGKGVFDTAAAAYQGALGKLNGPLLPAAHYNLGNTLFRRREYQKALDEYKESLIRNPGDADAKHNLEMALRYLQRNDSSRQNQQQQKQNKPDSSGNQQQNQQKQQQNDSTQNQQNRESNERNSADSSSGSKDQQQSEQRDQQSQPRPRGMTRADAERILDAIRNDELELQKRRAQRIVEAGKVAKDW